jgi:hypothetical protein
MRMIEYGATMCKIRDGGQEDALRILGVLASAYKVKASKELRHKERVHSTGWRLEECGCIGRWGGEAAGRQAGRQVGG